MVVDLAPAEDRPAGPSSARPRDAPPPRDAGSAHEVSWSHDLDTAWETARRANKPLFVYVRAGWSAPSLEMEANALVGADVARASRPYQPVFVDIVDDDVLVKAEARLGEPVLVTPMIVLYDLRTKRRRVARGALEGDEVVELLGAFVNER